MVDETSTSGAQTETTDAPNDDAELRSKQDDKQEAMTLREYESHGRDLYARFAEAVRGILLASLARCPEIKHQEVQARAKSVESLSKKLGDEVDTANVQNAVKDLAGVRIVLYTDSDIDRLDAARLLFENFDIEWDHTKIHYPVGENPETSHFIGRNYAVRLKEARTALPEYADFEGLRCEVQVQTILQHAWSETAHDTIYKSPDLGEIGTRNLTALKAQMNAIQRKYLIPAGHEFQKVLNSFERLASGKELIDARALEAIERADNNNEVCDLLDRMRDFVLPEVDEVRAWAPDFRRAAICAVQQAASRPITPIETPYGNFPGRAFNEVVRRAVRIVNGPELRYVDTSATLSTLIEMFLAAGTDDDAARLIVEAAGDLAEHNLYAWRHAGPFVQELLMETVSSLDAERIEAVRPLLVAVAEKVLGTEVEGTSSDSKSVTWTRGAVIISDALEKVRDQAIALIEAAFLAASNDDDRRSAVAAYKAATNLPHVGEPSDNLVIRVRHDTARMIRFLTSNANVAGNALLQSLEHDVYLRYRWNRQPREDAQISEAVAQAEREVTDAALAFRSHLAGFEDYGIFKVLVGFEAVFDDAWDAPDFGAARELNNTRRDERTAELLAGVNTRNATEWFDRLNRYAATKSSFPRLGQFIADVIKAEPSLGPIWLDQAQGQPISDFTPGILRGLYDAKADDAVAWAKQAMDDGKAVASVARFLSHAEPTLPDLIARMADVAVQLNNHPAALAVLEFAVKRIDDLGHQRAIEIGLNMIEFLAASSEDGWSDTVWLYSRESAFLRSLGEGDRRRLLAVMAELRRIDFHDEEILAVIAEKFPGDVVKMFGQRIEIECARDTDAFDPARYEAIPFNFQKLHEVFPQDAIDIALEAASSWSKVSDGLEEYRGGRFVANLFPDLPEGLIGALIVFAASGDKAKQDFVLAVTKNYESAPGVWIVLKELVAHLEPGSGKLDEVMIALEATGVTHGEFGSRNARIAQREAIEAWFNDARAPVQAFAKRFAQTLDNQIAAEQQRAERDIAQRRLEYGEPISPLEEVGDDEKAE